MLLLELHKHQKLAAKRHPMFDKNKFGKYSMYFMALFWMGYLLFIGIMLGIIIPDANPAMEGYHTFNKGIIFLLAIDFLLRFPLQTSPVQEMKVYLLFPIGKKKLIHFLLFKNLLSPYNLLWMFLLVPFSLAVITRLHGVSGILLYLIGWWLLFLANNYFYTFCRTLIKEHILFILLPILTYAALITLFFTTDQFSYCCMNLGESFILGNPLGYLSVLAVIALFWWLNRVVIEKVMYKELSKVEDTKVKHLSEYKFLDHFGEIGEYMRLELKMIFRNKSCRNLFMLAIAVMIMMELMLLTPTYDGPIGKDFVCTYNFIIFGAMFLSRLMGYEGNYIDGLMSRKESIYTLLRAKYYLYSIITLLPLFAMLAMVIHGEITLLKVLSSYFIGIGLTYFLFFQLAIYNTKTVPLNTTIMGKQSMNNGFQSLISIAAITLPILLSILLRYIVGDTIGQIIILLIGFTFVAFSHLWIRNIYHRFMKRRYENMEGFRNSK
ncbi:MAG: DUF5687 family protein [Bacteroidaceae bacterium]